MEFKKDDVVEAFGIRGIIVDNNIKYNLPVLVLFQNAIEEYFTVDGKFRDWHLEPSLKLIERPKKKVKKKFYLGHNDIINADINSCGNLHTYKDDDLIQDWKYISEVEIEVDEE